MFRLQWKLPVDQEVLPLPEPEPFNTDKYWTTGGYLHCDITVEPDVTTINYIESIESCKPWEHLKLPIECHLCSERKSHLPFLYQVHWCYFHCRTCQDEDVFVCEECFVTDEFVQLKESKHNNHKFVRIQTRPQSAPLFDGSELEQLRCFRKVTTAEEFFTYFPWFFHGFPGMDNFRYHYRQVFIEDMERFPDKSSESWLALRQRLDFPTDWFMRSFAHGDWTMLHRNLGPTIEAHIRTAEMSSRLHSYLLRLKRYNEVKVSKYGKNDVPFLTSNANLANSALLSNQKEYFRYTIPIHITGELNHEINQEGIKRLVQENNASDEFGYTNKSEEIDRLWSMFCLIYEDTPALKHSMPLATSGAKADVIQYLKPQWKHFIEKDIYIKRRLEEFRNQTTSRKREMEALVTSALLSGSSSISVDLNTMLEAPGLPKIPQKALELLLDSAVATPMSETSQGPKSLYWCQLQRRLGNFEECISALSTMNTSDPDVILELQRAYLDQGYLNKAAACIQPILDLELLYEADLRRKFASLKVAERDEQEVWRAATFEFVADDIVLCHSKPIACRLARLVACYANCFISGSWEEALAEVESVFDTYLREWELPDKSTESLMLLVYMEIYCHLILLTLSRDLDKGEPRDDAVGRLRSIREHLMAANSSPDMAWEILQAELELMKPTARAQYFEHEMNFSVHQYRHSVEIVSPVLMEFAVWAVRLKQALPMVEANVLLLLTEIGTDASIEDPGASKLIERADELYKRCGSEAGHLDVLFLQLKKRHAGFEEVKSLYDQIQKRNDMRRMRVVRAYQMAPTSQSSGWLLHTRASLGSLAKAAGDTIAYHRWNLRRYAADNMIVSSLNSAEAIISSDNASPIHSNFLTTMASFNLSRAYLTLGNYFEAAVHAMLHVGFCVERDDSEHFQRAILSVLEIFAEALNSNRSHSRKVVKDVARLWKGWLHYPVPRRWQVQDPRCDELDRFVDGACFLPYLLGKLASEANVGPIVYDEELNNIVISHLELAFSICDNLPLYMLPMVVPKLALAAGGVSTYYGNSELAIRCYWEGFRICHSQDLVTIGNIRMQTGKLMTFLAETDPEHWVHVVAPGRSLLRGASELFLETKLISGSLLKLIEANMWLLRSYVAQARAEKLLLDRWYTLEDSTNVTELIIKINSIAAVLKLAQNAMWMHEVVVSIITERLRLEAPYDSARHMVSILSSHVIERTRHLMLEIGLIMPDIERLQGQTPAGTLWFFTQRFKGSVLLQQSHYITNPIDIIRDIEKKPEAHRLYAREAELIKEGPQSLGDNRLNIVNTSMREIPVLNRLLERRSTRGIGEKDFAPLKDISQTSNPDAHMITIDWVQYNDIFLVIGYNITLGKIIFFDLTKTYRVVDVEKWVARHLKVSSDRLSTTLSSSESFIELQPLVSEISESCKIGDLLVFCPSQALNAIPLHAIPYSETGDLPIIFYHPVVYAPSNAILKDCVERALKPKPRLRFHASLFGRYGDSDPAEQAAIEDNLQNIASLIGNSNASVKTVLGKDVTRTSFSANLSGADILHFQGHVSSPEIKQFLVLEPEETSNKGSFTLQDIFATGLDARLAVLMGCGSGSQVISKGDDAMGLISAFFAAGVTSVVGTLWPLDNADAVTFSKHFYANILTNSDQPVEDAGKGKGKGKEEGKDLVNLAQAVREAILEMRACQRPRCKERRDLKGRMKCHLNESNSPYHWAQFALWGSWVCRGIEGDGKEEYTDEDQAAFEIAFAAALETDLKEKKAARKRKENMERVRKMLESMADE